MNQFKYFVQIFLLISFTLLISACGGKKPKKEISKDMLPDKENVSITMQGGVKTIEEEVVDYLKNVDESTGIYTFSDDADDLENLKQGDVVIFSGHSIKRIKKVEKAENHYKIHTEFAGLNEVIKDGEISWEKKFSWSKNTDIAKAAIISGDFIFASEGGTKKSASYDGTIKGWKVSITLSPEDEKLKIKLAATKSLNNQKVAAINADGWISNFDNTTSMNFGNGSLQSFKLDNKNLKGELDVKFAATGLGSDIAMIDIPAKIAFPFRVAGWIPVDLVIKANIKLYPEVKTGASSMASYKITYDADMGFTFGNNEAKSTGRINSQDMKVTGETVSAGIVTTGFGVGVEFPRFEISVLKETIVPYFLLDIHSTSLYEPGIMSNLPPCQEGRMKFKCIVGLNMKLFSLTYKQQKTLWEKERKWQKEGSKCKD